MEKIIVQKFGGSSLETLDHIKRISKYIASDIQKRSGKRLLVVSAMGDTTNELISLAHSVSDNPNQRELDMLITTGERKSMALMAIACQELGLKTISFTGSQAGVLTRGGHGNASIIDIKPFRILESFQNYDVVIVAGFQGVDPKTKEITSLGRGGSDLTAVALGHYVSATDVEIFTDVSGVFACDPKHVDFQIEPFSHLSWERMFVMAQWGAQVVHERAAEFALTHKTRFCVKNSFEPESNGTLISEQCAKRFRAVCFMEKDRDQILSFFGVKDVQPKLNSISVSRDDSEERVSYCLNTDSIETFKDFVVDWIR